MLKPEFVEYLDSVPELTFLKESLLSEPDVAVRVNPAKGLPLPEGQRVPWCPEGVYLPVRPKFTLDPALHQGRYYVQDASSMAIAAAVRRFTADGVPVRYLDACAAPGGKATAALSAQPADSLMVANEFDSKRAEILCENLAKWGAPGVMATRGDTSRFAGLDGVFDIIAVDAPCSGEGMMRKDETARRQWSRQLVADCAALQRSIIDNVWPALRPGGILIYSTCTFNLHEDEENLRYIIDTCGAESLAIPDLDAAEGVMKGISAPCHCYRFLPGKIRGEGLFLAAVRKPGNARAAELRPLKTKKQKDGFMPTSDLGWLSGDYRYFERNGEIYALPAAISPVMLALAQKLWSVAFGIHVATKKGKDLIPTQELAMTTALRRGAFAENEVSLDDALAYLRRDAVSLPEDTPRGFVLLTFGGLPLGFVKNLGNRCNNLYPVYWKIRN